MNKIKKWLFGIGILVILGIVGNCLPKNDTEDNQEIAGEVLSQDVSLNEKKEPSLSKDELINVLEGYETLFNNHIQGLDKVAQNNDNLEMQKSFSETKDAAYATFGLLSDLKKEYDSNSNEYKTINELQTVFNSLQDACKHGISYIDKNEYKYYEKYESSLNECSIFIERYNEAKENI